MINKSRDLALLIVFALALFLISLGARDLWNPNEAIYGLAVAEMWTHHNWLIPTFNDTVFAEKPILYYWLALGAAYLFGGVNEWTLRLPSVLAGILSLIGLFYLVSPYVGRARALLAAYMFATMHLVFWTARSVQMDIWVVAAAIGVLLPVTRVMDHGFSPAKGWALAGLAAGIGFAAKGPVTLITPGITYLVYGLATGRIKQLIHPWLLLGGLIALLVGSPWHLALWVNGETDFLYEVLIRQNFTRFVDAWDHQHPWWYYLTYFLTDYAPWSWIAPLAFFVRPDGEKEQKLHRLAWIWLLGGLIFFSLSDSKRNPYLLPIAPAIAMLASSVAVRFQHGALSKRVRLSFRLILSFFGLLLLLIGAFVWLWAPGEFPDLIRPAILLGTTAIIFSLLILASLWLGARTKLKPTVMTIAGLSAIFLVASIWVLPSINHLKSARVFSDKVKGLIRSDDALASYKLQRLRAGYPYYIGRTIPNLLSERELNEFWSSGKTSFLIVEEPYLEEAKNLLALHEPVAKAPIGSRKAYLFARPKAISMKNREEAKPGQVERGKK